MVEKIREMKDFLNLREKEFFSPLAALSEKTIRRTPSDPGTRPGYRQGFSKDADRILNSLAYTRYIDKTQVFSLIQNTHLTYRIVHVQLLSRIARTIGRYLGLNEDLIEAASLGHDIGHPPFGHDGEQCLSELTEQHGCGYFHHNLQSIRFLEMIERSGRGWNLSLQTLDAIVCHNGEVHSTELKPDMNRTFEDFDRMIQRMETEKRPDSTPMTMEGCVVRMADTISYVGRDMEDAVRLGLIGRDELPEDVRRILGETNGTIVYNLVTDIISNSMRQPYVTFSEKASHALLTLKKFNYENIYKNPKIKQHLKGTGNIFVYLFETYLNDIAKENSTSDVFTEFLDHMPDSYRKEQSHARIVTDFISSMTDSSLVAKAPQHMRPDPIHHV
ncbi:MAG: HD domain-containing protein [Desulfarculaceae bacterium]|nr:HD domain-containing protein [Desulfarculaceae bacterium]